MATGRGTLVATRLHVGRSGRVRGRPVMLALVGILALVGALILGVGLGTVAIAPGDTIAIIAHRLFGLNLGATWTPATEAIVWELRLPRALLAALVGAALVFITGIGVPLRLGLAADTMSYANALAFAHSLAGKVVVFGVISLFLWHAAHRVVILLHDLGVHAMAFVRFACYGSAFAGTAFAGHALMRIGW